MNYSLRRQRTLRREIEKNTNLIQNLRRQLRIKRQLVMQRLHARRVLERQRNRQKRRCSVEVILKELEHKQLLCGDDALHFSGMQVDFDELYSKEPFEELSTNIQAFALMLNYYSPRGYNYVKKSFDTCLPHPRIIRKWYTCDDGNPGFSKVSFEALKLKANTEDHELYCCLTVYNMSITCRVEVDGMAHGYIEFGQNSIDDFVSDSSAEVRESYVFLVSCINGNFKVPVGYFLTEVMTGPQIKNLTIACLEQLHETGINIVALSLDGSSSHRKAAELLGCKLDPFVLKATFNHPVTGQPIAVIFDPSELLDSTKMTLSSRSKIKVKEENGTVKWDIICKLHEIKEKGYVNNNDKKNQIKYYHQKRKLGLALELFSGSLADTAAMCFDSNDSKSTINYIRNFNTLVNICNSRNLKSEIDYLKPLSLQNKDFIFNYFSYLVNYIHNILSNFDNQLVAFSNWNFICMLLNMLSIETLVEIGHTKSLPLSKLSTGELTLLFYNARSYNGNRMSVPPTAKNFKLYYKKLIKNLKMKKTESGKYIELEKISVLNNCTGLTTINATTGRRITNNYEDDKVGKKEFDIFFEHYNKSLMKCNLFSKLALQTVTFFAGMAVQFLIKKLKCEICLDAVSGSKIDKSISFRVIHFEYKDELMIPSPDVIKICEVVEGIFKPMLKTPGKKDLKKIKQEILYKALQSLIGVDLLKSIENHQFEQSPLENHVVNLIRAVAEVYIDIRFQYLDQTVWERQRHIEWLKLY